MKFDGIEFGMQVIAVAKSADLVLMFLDATKPDAHRAALEKELDTAGPVICRFFFK